jgi:multiple sugar transport system substrate-binding protein
MYPGTDAEYIPKIMSQHAAGSLGDVFWQCNVWMLPQTCAEKGILMPLDDLIASAKTDMKQWYPSAVKSQQYKGKQVGLPMKTHPDAPYVHYNKTLIKAAGFQEPKEGWTIDEFKELGKALTKESGGKFSQWGARLAVTWWDATDVLRAFGGDSYSADGTKALWNSPKSVEALNWVYSLYEAGICPNPTALQGTNEVNLMASGRLGLFQSGIWVGSQLKAVADQGGAAQGFEWWVTMFPQTPAKVPVPSFAVTDGVSLSSLTKNPEGAFKLAQYLTDKEAGVQLCLGDGVCGSRYDIRDDKRVQGTTLSKDDKALFNIYWKGVEGAMPFYHPANLRHFEVAAYCTQTLAGLWLGKEKPNQQFYDNLNAGAQKIIDMPLI